MKIPDLFSRLFSGNGKTEEPSDSATEKTDELNNETALKEKKPRHKKTITDARNSHIEESDEVSEDDNGKSAPKKKKDSSETTNRSDLRSMFNHVIDEDERQWQNYIRPSFWTEKHREYKQLREKEKQDLDVYTVLSSQATPTVEYYVLTVLSSVIATMGLLQGSTATIIGAMIIAPLMPPILALSLAVIWGDITLFRKSIASVVKAVFWALVISAGIAWLVPIPEYSTEITSRVHPSLFDIVVAVASGIVGAYGYANKRISNTLVGIAIAVALMPPLCTVGIGLGHFNLSMASGAMLLFMINFIAISLSGAVVFWAMKIHPVTADSSEVKSRAIWQIAFSLLVLVAIAVPVGFYMYESFRTQSSISDLRIMMEGNCHDVSILDIHTRQTDEGTELILLVAGEKEKSLEKIRALRDSYLESHSFISRVSVRFMKSILLDDAIPDSSP